MEGVNSSMVRYHNRKKLAEQQPGIREQFVRHILLALCTFSQKEAWKFLLGESVIT
ncbi:unnamed protein product [Lupinus luteus]|uniref:Uncharacterized protein n=1 Tax=Lupinus luteus TaxID=3873 RepID=A0AAV1XDM3_LUPLU